MYKFINPYNFIPMGEKRSKADIVDKEKLVSGVIEYSVCTKTPLFIPNTSYDRFYGGPEEHKSYQFFSYVDYSIAENREAIPNPKPVIPGSEIRGMFRSNYEILTNSCMSALDSDMMLSKRTMESYKPGLLRKGTDADGKVCYDLYEAEDVLWRTKGKNNTEDDLEWKDDLEHKNRECYIQKDFPEGSCVGFKMHRRGKEIKSLASKVELWTDEMQNDGKHVKGYIIKGEKSPGGRSKKHCCHIFVLKEENGSPLKREITISLLDDLLSIYEKNIGFYREYREKFAEFKKGDTGTYFPVYYSQIGNFPNQKTFVAPACKTREIYDNTLKNLAEGLAPCTKKSGFCEACELFGTVTSDGESRSSKIRFADLIVEKKENNKDYYLPKVTLPELSSPKLNNMEFYVERPENARFWTYDYYIDKNGVLHLKQGKLAGRKFYWHQELKDSDVPKDKPNKRNVTIRPVRSGNVFNGKLFFDRITKETLDKIIYLLNAGEESGELKDKQYGYKIGMAKPLGFGSIACNVNKVLLKSYDIKEGIPQRLDTPYQSGDILEVETKLIKQSGDSVIKNFHKMTRFDSVKLGENEHFSYPKENESSEGYSWYTKNHKGIKNNMPNSRKEMYFEEYLEAMVPRVKRTGVSGGTGNRQNIRNQNTGNTNNRNANNRNQNQNKNTGYMGSNNVETATVVEYKKPSVIRFKTESGKIESIPCNKIGLSSEAAQEKYPPGCKIKVRFKGVVAGSGFRKYIIIE